MAPKPYSLETSHRLRKLQCFFAREGRYRSKVGLHLVHLRLHKLLRLPRAVMQDNFVSTTEHFVKNQIATLEHDASHDWRCDAMAGSICLANCVLRYKSFETCFLQPY